MATTAQLDQNASLETIDLPCQLPNIAAPHCLDQPPTFVHFLGGAWEDASTAETKGCDSCELQRSNGMLVSVIEY